MIKFYSIFLIVSFVIFSSCKNTEEEYASEPPPLSSIYFDFDQFDFFTYSKSENLGYASEILSQWKSIVDDSLSLTVTAYENSTATEAFYQAEQQWLWENEFSESAGTYSTKLFGICRDDTADWKLFMTKEGEFTDLMILTGSFTSDLSEGLWHVTKINQTKTTSELSYVIDWKSTEIGSVSIKYTNILQGSADNGNFILVADSVYDNFDIFADIYDKAKDTHTFIQFNKSEKFGRIKSEEHFGDTLWRCWDQAGNDVVCN